jgi:hypothetical protein
MYQGLVLSFFIFLCPKESLDCEWSLSPFPYILEDNCKLQDAFTNQDTFPTMKDRLLYI